MNENQIYSVMDARRYREQLAARNPDRDPALGKWRACKRCVLLLLLAASFLIYYTISINIEILSLPTIYIAVPAKLPKSVDRTRLTAP